VHATNHGPSTSVRSIEFGHSQQILEVDLKTGDFSFLPAVGLKWGTDQSNSLLAAAIVRDFTGDSLPTRHFTNHIYEKMTKSIQSFHYEWQIDGMQFLCQLQAYTPADEFLHAAAMDYGVPYYEVTEAMRSSTKTKTLGLMYGMTRPKMTAYFNNIGLGKSKVNDQHSSMEASLRVDKENAGEIWVPGGGVKRIPSPGEGITAESHLSERGLLWIKNRHSSLISQYPLAPVPAAEDS